MLMSHVQVSSPPEPSTVTNEPVLPMPQAEAEQPAAVAEGLGRPGAHTNGIAQDAVDKEAQQADVIKVYNWAITGLSVYYILFEQLQRAVPL